MFRPRPDGVHWDGIEYWDPQRKRGALYAFRGSGEGDKTHTFVLQGLDPSGRYLLKFHDHSSPDRQISGRDLAGKGLRVNLPVPNSSEIIFVETAD